MVSNRLSAALCSKSRAFHSANPSFYVNNDYFIYEVELCQTCAHEAPTSPAPIIDTFDTYNVSFLFFLRLYSTCFEFIQDPRTFFAAE